MGRRHEDEWRGWRGTDRRWYLSPFNSAISMIAFYTGRFFFTAENTTEIMIAFSGVKKIARCKNGRYLSFTPGELPDFYTGIKGVERLLVVR